MADQDAPTLTDLAADLAAEADVKEEPAAPQEPAPEESSTEETKEPEVAEAEAETEEEKPQGDDNEVTDEETPDDTKAEEQPRGKAEERKDQLNTEIRDLVAKRNAIKQEVERLNAETYNPQTAEELINQGMDENSARIAAMEQREELRQYNDRVAEAQLTIGNESERVLRDFPMFDPESSQYVPQVATQAARLLQQNLIIDQNTQQVIGSHVSPYELYKTIYDANQASAVDNQIKGQRAAEQMEAAAEPQSSSVPKEKKEDPFLTGLLGKQ